jgi:hypothetical protein
MVKKKKMKASKVGYKYFVLLVFIFFFINSCSNNIETFTAKERSIVKDNVKLMTDSIAITISHEGPIAWLKYFENTPDFFMVSDGQLVFPNIDTAKYFINNILVTKMPKLELRWRDVRIDPLTKEFANVAAFYHEDIPDSGGKKIPYDGYFTAIAHRTSLGWKLHNAHWSNMKAD